MGQLKHLKHKEPSGPTWDPGAPSKKAVELTNESPGQDLPDSCDGNPNSCEEIAALQLSSQKQPDEDKCDWKLGGTDPKGMAWAWWT